MLWMVQRVFFGLPAHRERPPLTDLNLREVVTALPFVLLALAMGIYPQPFLDRFASSSTRFVARANLGLSGSTASDSAVEMKVMPLPEAGARMRSDRGPPGSREKLRAARQ
jgi:NADH-quinone oxidoreductase subunit M